MCCSGDEEVEEQDDKKKEEARTKRGQEKGSEEEGEKKCNEARTQEETKEDNVGKEVGGHVLVVNSFEIEVPWENCSFIQYLPCSE